MPDEGAGSRQQGTLAPRPSLDTRTALRLTQRAIAAVSAGVTATSLTSCATVPFTATVAAWALLPPQQLSRLLVAIAFVGMSIALGLLIGRRVTRRVHARLTRERHAAATAAR